jgi:hypothetical protein
VAGSEQRPQSNRSERRVCRRKPVSCGNSRLLGQLVLDPQLLQLRQVLDKHSPLQMVDLVLQAYRQQTGRLNGLLLAFQIQVTDDDVFGTLNLVVNPGHRQASLLADLQAILLDDLPG